MYTKLALKTAMLIIYKVCRTCYAFSVAGPSV